MACYKKYCTRMTIFWYYIYLCVINFPFLDGGENTDLQEKFHCLKNALDNKA